MVTYHWFPVPLRVYTSTDSSSCKESSKKILRLQRKLNWVQPSSPDPFNKNLTMQYSYPLQNYLTLWMYHHFKITATSPNVEACKPKIGKRFIQPWIIVIMIVITIIWNNNNNNNNNNNLMQELKCDVIILQSFPFEPLNLVIWYTQML